MTTLFQGSLLRLTAANPDSDADVEALRRWSRDSEYLRLQNGDPAFPRSVARAKEILSGAQDHDGATFILRSLDDDRALGFVGLWVNWPHRDAWLGIGIGDRADWSKGYGTEALRLALRYAFTELNLHRVSLTVLEGNARAVRAYEKAGFVLEGQAHQYSRYDGQWLGEVFMGVLKEDWERRLEK
jgi:RimJ/RimL family protein N-acetyltransferase